MQEFGVPRYCKIDVEGYEREVVRGLSKRVGVISYEFTHEFMDHALEVLRLLLRLDYTKFNLSIGDRSDFHFPKWVSFYEISSILHASRGSDGLWGDIYAN